MDRIEKCPFGGILDIHKEVLIFFRSFAESFWGLGWKFYLGFGWLADPLPFECILRRSSQCNQHTVTSIQCTAHSTVHNTAQHNTAQHSTAQHSTQHSTAQHTAQSSQCNQHTVTKVKRINAMSIMILWMIYYCVSLENHDDDFSWFSLFSWLW